MTKRVKTPGSEAIREARQAFPEEYPHATDWQIKRLALLSVARDAFEAQVAAGQNIDLGALLRIDEVIEQTRETIKKTEPMKVTVEFVHGAAVTCPSCSHEFNPHTSEPVKPFRGVVACHKCGAKSEVSNKPFDAPESQPQQPSSGDPAPLLAEPAQPSANVVPMKVSHRYSVSASSFHSQVINGREIPPLKRERPSHYRSEAVERERHPYRDAAGGDRSVAHPLPVPHGVIW